MKNNEYLLPALASIAVAILFPIYWGSQLLMSHASLRETYDANLMSLDFSDALYLLIGVLAIYVYLSLKRILSDQLNYRGLDFLLIIMIALCAIVYIGALGFDLAIYLADRRIGVINLDAILSSSFMVNIGGMIIFGIVDILIGIILLRRLNEIPSLLKIFAVITLIQGVFEITIVFSFTTIFIFPLSMLVLAAYFMKKPEIIEVV